MKKVRVLSILVSGTLLTTASLAATMGTTQTVAIAQTGQDPSNVSNPPSGSDASLYMGVPWSYNHNGGLTPSNRFTKGVGAEANCITDNLTGLMWVKDTSSVPINGAKKGAATSYPNAVNSITAMNKASNICGHNDWRIPTLNELRSTVNYADDYGPSDWLNQNGFNIMPAYYWSSSNKVPNSEAPYTYKWMLHMQDGLTDFASSNQYSSLLLWPVRSAKTTLPVTAPVIQTGEAGSTGIAWPAKRFTSDTTGKCMTDNLTNLVWLKNMNDEPTSLNGYNRFYTWNNALTMISELNAGNGLCGYNDWRIPNINEMASLINVTKPDMAAWLNSQGFNVLGAGFYWSYYWTSTAFAGDTVDQAWAMNSDGVLDYYDNWSALYVLPVRGGQCNNIPCKNLPVANAPVVSVPTAPTNTVANTPLQIYDSIPGDLYCDYNEGDLPDAWGQTGGGQTPVVDVDNQLNTQLSNNQSAIVNWSFISGLVNNGASVYGSASCGYNLNMSKSNWRSALYVYRIMNTVTIQARTNVAAANGVEAQITCNNAVNPNVVQTYTLQNSNVINCNVGGTNSIPVINLTVFSPTTN